MPAQLILPAFETMLDMELRSGRPFGFVDLG